MSRDSTFTYVHLHCSHHADMLEDFTRVKLPAEDIYVPPQHQPINPDDEDDVVPDQHAAFGIQRATQKAREPAWRDLGLDNVMWNGPPPARAPIGRRTFRIILGSTVRIAPISEAVEKLSKSIESSMAGVQADSNQHQPELPALDLKLVVLPH